MVMDSVTDAESFALIGEGAQILKGLNEDSESFFSDLGRLREIIKALTGGQQAPAPSPEPAQPPTDARRATGYLFTFDPARKPSQRKKDNTAAMALLARVNSGEVPADSLTDADKALLAKYSGTGGGLIGADGKHGSAYEYYTPKPIAAATWSVLADLGFAGGKVLDPCAGTGVFGATAPASAVVDAVELNQTSGQVNRLVNGGPGYAVTVAPFESVAASTPDEEYDAVVANVPFGKIADRGGNELLDNKYQKQPLQNYFILRSLEKLRPGGLAAFIAPPRCLSGKGGKEEWLRQQISYTADFIGAYRLPNSVFGTASADTITDVIFLRKFSAEVAGKVAELREQSPQTLLDAKVIWPTFVGGNYFSGEGSRFVLGEFKPKNPEKVWDIDRVINPASVEEVAAMLRKLPDSRIDFGMLDTAETELISYADGDTVYQGGQTLQMQDGRWVAIQSNENSGQLASLLATLSTPYAAFEAGASWEDAKQCMDWMTKTSQAMDIPGWLRDTNSQISALPVEQQGGYWTAGVVGLCVSQVLDERAGESLNYLAEYGALSDAMRQQYTLAKKRPGCISGPVRDGLVRLSTHYRGTKNGFGAVWRGDVEQDAPEAEFTADSTFDGIVYRQKSPWVSLDEAKSVFGEEFAPLTDPAWCVSPDGQKIIRADDYYVGNYGELLTKLDVEISVVKDDAIRAKLLRQKSDAASRVERIDVKTMTFNLFSPFVTNEEKAEFLRRFVHPAAAEVFDDGKPRVDIDIKGSKLGDKEKLLNRFGDYLKNGTLTLGSAKFSMPDDVALSELRKMVETANEQFASWAKSNRQIMDRMEVSASDPDRLRFSPVDDQSPVKIPGMNPSLTLHGYQNAFVRRQGREFGGILGDGVGLGKTFEALAAVQYAHSIGVKKKTIFAVPNSVLSNWQKEAGRAYASTEDCLFVGLRVRKGKAAVDSSAYDIDLASIAENRHSKIFMSFEALERLRLREETINGFEKHMRQVDKSFGESEDKKADERAKGKVAGMMAVLSDKTGSAPFLEDLGIDSLVIDEAHAFKNSAVTVGFKAAKFLSLAPMAKRGLDAQAKAWYIRGLSARQDGVLPMTATPITNSPLEIYSMLSLSVGHQRVNDACLGVNGADDFMDTVCVKANEPDVSVDGIPRNATVFVGLQNVSILRLALGQNAMIRDAKQVGAQVKVPNREEIATGVALPKDVTKRLMDYKHAYRWAADDLRNVANRGDIDAYNRIAEELGEPQELIAHPFNLIRKMELLVTGGHELDRRTTVYLFPEDQAHLALSAVDEFNTRAIIEERKRMTPEASEADVVGKKTVKDGEDETELLKIRVRAHIDAGRIVIDTIDPETQDVFESIADKLGLAMDVTITPKLAVLIENIKNEMTSPRGMNADGTPSAIVKQIIFCDILPLHNKIKRLLAKHAGIPMGKIAVVTGKKNNKSDQIMAVQDGFNAEGSSNRYQIVLANEKAEVGINLQIGTQALHHLTIGWTPDSLEQRNGRGARQGNKTEVVRIYHYDADGTFDCYKREMVNKKSEWIDHVLDKNGDDSVAIAGGLSRDQMDSLIDSVGDSDGIARAQAAAAMRETEARAAANRSRQMVNLDTIAKQRKFLAENKNAENYIKEKALNYWSLLIRSNALQDRIDKPGAKESAIAKNRSSMDAISARMHVISQEIESSATFSGVGSFSDLVKVLGAKETQGDKMAVALKLYYRVIPNEKGALIARWDEDVEMAKAMIDESASNFTKQSKEAGSIPAIVVEAAKSGKVYPTKDGRVLIDGAFIVDGENLLAVYDNRVVILPKYTNPPTYPHAIDAAESKASTLNESAKIVYPGTADYSAHLQSFAEYEDAMADGGYVSNEFSEKINGVGELRRSDAVTKYSATESILPHPYFPHPIPPSRGLAASSQARNAIIEQQKAIIIRWDVISLAFFAKASAGVIPSDARPEDRAKDFADYAKANGLTVEHHDFGGYQTIIVEREMHDISAFGAALTGITPEEVNASAKAYIDQLIPWFPRAFEYIPVSAKVLLNSAIEAVTPKKIGDEWVAVSSNYNFTELTSIRKFAESMGERAAWIDKFGRAKEYDLEVAKNRPGAPPNTWVIKRIVYDALVEKYPSATTKYSLKIRAGGGNAMTNSGQFENNAGSHPHVLNGHPGAIVIFNNLASIPAATFVCPTDDYGKAVLALELDQAMREQAPAGWKGDDTREKQVLNALFPIMSRDRVATQAIFEIIKSQSGY